MEKMDKGLSAKMGTDKLTESTPNAPKFMRTNCLPSPKVWFFDEKRLYWASVVHEYVDAFRLSVTQVGSM